MEVNITSYVGMGAAFKEFVFILMDTLAERGYSYLTSREPNPNLQNIVIGAAHTPTYYLSQNLPSNTIIINLEQLYDGCRWEGDYITLLSKFRVWDYSTINIEWLSKRGIKAELFHRLYSPKLETIIQLTEDNKDIDVLFYGTATEDRKQIRKLLEKALSGKNIIFCVGLWADQKDRMIARSKVILNLHGYPSNIFESSRVCHLLSNKAFVITENSMDDADYPEVDEGLIRTDRKDIVNTVVKYLDLPQERNKIALQGYNSVKNSKPRLPECNF